MSKKYWDDTFGDHATYMESYGEGVGSATRRTIFEYIGKDDSLLDVGCGPGWNFEHGREIEGWTGAYKGTDFSYKFIEACIAKYGNSITHMWEVQDARAMTEANKSWDVVLLQDIVEHTDGYEKPVYEAMRVARRKVIVTFWRSLSESDEDDVKLSEGYDDDWCGSYSRPKLEKWLHDLVQSKTIYHWVKARCEINKPHDFYILYLEGIDGEPIPHQPVDMVASDIVEGQEE
jgi:ubiquinone/menaquinone biosynthesis C-methylase UbiE